VTHPTRTQSSSPGPTKPRDLTVRTTGSLDGAGAVALFTQSWLPDDATEIRGTVVIVHGFGEHSDRYDHVADRLSAEGFAVAPSTTAVTAARRDRAP
jgi:hypothetical protein